MTDETSPVTISLEILPKLSAELRCMDLFEQLMVTHEFSTMDRLIGGKSALIWMREIIDRKIEELGESK
jgi:hypothetical protein